MSVDTKGTLSVTVTGGATEAKQDTQEATLVSILGAQATAANQSTEIAGLAAIITALGPLATQATLASILAAVATAAKQDSILTALGPLGTAANQASIIALLAGGLPAALVNGLLKTSLGDPGITRYTSASLEKVASITATATRLFKYRAINTNAATNMYMMLFDKASAPVNGDTPVWEGAIRSFGAQDFDDFDFSSVGGLALTNGLAVGASTTGGTLTIISANDVRHCALYK